MPPILIALLYILIGYYFWWLFLLMLPVAFVVFTVWLAGRISIPLISGYIARRKEGESSKNSLKKGLNISQKVSRLFVVVRKLLYFSNSPCELERRIYMTH